MHLEKGLPMSRAEGEGDDLEVSGFITRAEKAIARVRHGE